MFNNNFMLKLVEYLGGEIRYSINENDIEIYVDAEIQYKLRKLDEHYTLFMIERGIETKIDDFYSEIETRRIFPIYMKGLIGAKVEYPHVKEFEQLTNINQLKEFMIQFTNGNLFSINQIVANNVILTNKTYDSYDLIFVDKNFQKYYIEQNEKAPFIFKRFYMEVVCYSEMLKRFEEYESYFEDLLDYECKLKMLNY